ncbi:MAG: ParB N-terminal domain-containing protein [Candidatus Pacebacteria bacterium]|nr:ParB N-terminal domain-containing protein [Candidatus Paceibacterota bacterium]
MKTKYTIIKNNLIKEHEEINKEHLQKLLAEIKQDGFINDPIIVDKNTMILLDGHHRLNVVKILGLTLVPVYLIDYQNKEIRVHSWRKGIKVTKEMVVSAGLTGKLLQAKTSKHLIPKKPTGLKIPLTTLS